MLMTESHALLSQVGEGWGGGFCRVLAPARNRAAGPSSSGVPPAGRAGAAPGGRAGRGPVPPPPSPGPLPGADT